MSCQCGTCGNGCNNYTTPTSFSGVDISGSTFTGGSIQGASISGSTIEGILAAVDTLADLRATSVTNLVTGDTVEVLGHTAAGDGGGGLFRYDSASVSVDDNGTIIEPTSGTGAWFRVYSGPLHAGWFGVRAGSNSYNNSNRAAMEDAFAVLTTNGGGTLILPDGDIYYNPTFTLGTLNVPSNTTIRAGKRTRIIVDLDGDTERWTVFRIFGGNNILIDGGEIVGDKTTVLAGSNYGYGITINSTSSNVVVKNTVVRDCYTDSYLISSSGSNFLFENVEAYSPRRNGLAIVQGTNIRIVNSEFSGASGLGTLEAGIDIETEAATDVTDVVISNCRFHGNGTHNVYIHKGVGAGLPKRVVVEGCLFTDSPFGVAVAGAISGGVAYLCEDISIVNNVFNDNGDSASDASIVVSDTFSFVINSNVISDGYRGIYLPRVNRGTVNSNTIRNTGDTAIEVFDDNVLNPVYDVQYVGNSIYNTAEFGIVAAGTSVTVAENVVDGVQKGGITVSASPNTKVVGNSIFNCSLAANDVYSGIFVQGTGGSFIGNVVRKGRYSQLGTAQAGAALSITLSGNAPSLTNVLNGYYVKILSGTGVAGESRLISAYNGTTKVATIAPAWTTNPDATTVYEVLPAGNIQKYGMLVTGDNIMLMANDIELSGGTANFLDGGINTRRDRLVQSSDQITGAGAINPYTPVTRIWTTAANALTLADGIDGQVKTLVMVVDNGDGTLTPATKLGYTTITFTDPGDAVVLQFFASRGWVILSNNGCTVA